MTYMCQLPNSRISRVTPRLLGGILIDKILEYRIQKVMKSIQKENSYGKEKHWWLYSRFKESKRNDSKGTGGTAECFR